MWFIIGLVVVLLSLFVGVSTKKGTALDTLCALALAFGALSMVGSVLLHLWRTLP